MSFDAANWVLVCDMEQDPYSKQQIEKLNEFGYEIKGAIQCNDTKYKDSEPCKKVPALSSTSWLTRAWNLAIAAFSSR